MDAINRSAVIVTPSQTFLDWLHRADPTSADLSRSLKNSLMAGIVPSTGPVDRTFSTFSRWFEFSFHSVLFDLCDDPLKRDER
jgi:hypothetical protein